MTVGPIIVKIQGCVSALAHKRLNQARPNRREPCQEDGPPQPPREHVTERHGKAEEDERCGGEDEIEEAGQREVDGLVGVDEAECRGLLVSGCGCPLLGQLSSRDGMTSTKPTVAPTTAANRPNRARAPAIPPRIEW